MTSLSFKKRLKYLSEERGGSILSGPSLRRSSKATSIRYEIIHSPKSDDKIRSNQTHVELQLLQHFAA